MTFGFESFDFFGVKIRSPEYYEGYGYGYSRGKRDAIKMLKKVIKELEKKDGNLLTATTTTSRRKRK